MHVMLLLSSKPLLALRFFYFLAWLVVTASGKILMFENNDVGSQHYHVHTETLFAAQNNRSKTPFVSFDVFCPAGAGQVLWMVVDSDIRGVGRWHESNDTTISARCGGANVMLSCSSGMVDPDVHDNDEKNATTATPTITTTTTTVAPGRRRRRGSGGGKNNKNKNKNKKKSNSDTTTTTTSTAMTRGEEEGEEEDMVDENEGEEVPTEAISNEEEMEAESTAPPPPPSSSSSKDSKTTSLPASGVQVAQPTGADKPHSGVTGTYCHEQSGLLYVRDRVRSIVGGCVVCAADVEHYERVAAPVFTRDGFYTLWVESVGKSSSSSSGEEEEEEGQLLPGPRITGKSTFMNSEGYLSSTLVPLMSFYGGLGVFYLGFGLVWLALMICHYKDILRLQFWIGAVILLGELEMAVSYGDLYYLNDVGLRSQSLMVSSKIIYSAKNTLARLLVLIVSMGYGVVRPRLGGALKQIVAIGAAYFFLSTAYGVMHAFGQTESKEAKTEMMVIIPLSVLDAAIFWWIFISLSHTMKTLRLRKNEVKLSLYSRFQATLIICVLATVIFTAWSIYDRFGSDPDAEMDWQNAWWQDGYWHLLFFSVLTVIMILWRPTTNNQRYAYSALETDLEEDEEYRNVVPHFGSDAMKMRTFSSRGLPVPEHDSEPEDDLRWVEENIPSAMPTADNAFPNMPMDSEEELMDTKFQQSKME